MQYFVHTDHLGLYTKRLVTAFHFNAVAESVYYTEQWALLKFSSWLFESR